jgi:LysM repeat protein
MVDEIKAKGSVTPANNEYEVNKTGKVVAMADYYVVKKGDVLWKIAKKYDIDYKKLGEMNNLKNNNVIVVGQKLKIAK